MKFKILAAAVCAAALPVLAQTSKAPVEPRQAQLEVSRPGATTTAPKKASRSTKAHKSPKTAKKSTKKKAKKPQSSAG